MRGLAATALFDLVDELIDYHGGQFDAAGPYDELAVSGSMAVEWLYEFRKKVRTALHRFRAVGVMAANPAPAQVFVVRAEHWHVPGVLASAHRTPAGAAAAAVEYTNLLLDDDEQSKPDATAENWQARVAYLQREHGDKNVYVELDTFDLSE